MLTYTNHAALSNSPPPHASHIWKQPTSAYGCWHTTLMSPWLCPTTEQNKGKGRQNIGPSMAWSIAVCPVTATLLGTQQEFKFLLKRPKERREGMASPTSSMHFHNSFGKRNPHRKARTSLSQRFRFPGNNHAPSSCCLQGKGDVATGTKPDIQLHSHRRHIYLLLESRSERFKSHWGQSIWHKSNWRGSQTLLQHVQPRSGTNNAPRAISAQGGRPKSLLLLHLGPSMLVNFVFWTWCLVVKWVKAGSAQRVMSTLFVRGKLEQGKAHLWADSKQIGNMGREE